MRGQLLSIEGGRAEVLAGRAGGAAGEPRLAGPSEAWGARLVQQRLNYGYGILYSQVERALVLAGLDPYAGFIHVDRPGKPSMVLDLIEPFRAPVVDRPMLGLANRGVKIEQDERGFLTEAARRQLADSVLDRLEAQEPYEGKRQRLQSIIQMQARQLATFVRNEREEYEPFIARW